MAALVVVKKPFLRKRNKEQRLRFVKVHKNWTERDRNNSNSPSGFRKALHHIIINSMLLESTLDEAKASTASDLPINLMCSEALPATGWHGFTATNQQLLLKRPGD
uniref:Uncharacterized protein n=1 Tax=Haplochromis burtoni TaxID=8153 RepID=A0A3Q2V7P1_HAPBU